MDSEDSFQDLYGLWLIIRRELEDEIGFDERKILEKQMSDIEVKMRDQYPVEFNTVFPRPLN